MGGKNEMAKPGCKKRTVSSNLAAGYTYTARTGPKISSLMIGESCDFARIMVGWTKYPFESSSVYIRNVVQVSKFEGRGQRRKKHWKPCTCPSSNNLVVGDILASIVNVLGNAAESGLVDDGGHKVGEVCSRKRYERSELEPKR
jgi:hypothetical protein